VWRNEEAECWTCWSCTTARVPDGGVCGSSGTCAGLDVPDADGAKETGDILRFDDNYFNTYNRSVRWSNVSVLARSSHLLRAYEPHDISALPVNVAMHRSMETAPDLALLLNRCTAHARCDRPPPVPS
jgi:hypothetical protein